MGIRTLHHRTAPPRPAADGPREPLPPVPALSPAASTARVPATRASAVRHVRHVRHVRDSLGRRLGRRPPAAPRPASRTAAWRSGTDLLRGYLALALTRLPRSRPDRTMTLFVATAAPVDARAAEGER
ncbi:hypothetical protein [Streptomyces sp. CRN 30]|uniref:hypothetical protein n=1 Tax=Streptomyces sp. CRN 30 TaxID=3075613 RepID=UPI002A8007E3|nr:hypothetical protein [Streptomyces sp. CRN 30]